MDSRLLEIARHKVVNAAKRAGIQLKQTFAKEGKELRAEGLNSKVATIQKRACGYRNPQRFKIAVYFHCGGLNLWPPRFTH